MLARLGRVIYWFCCGIAGLLAIIPAILNGSPILEKAPPPINEVEQASIQITSENQSRITYVFKLPGGAKYEVDYDSSSAVAKYQRKRGNSHDVAPGMFDDLIPSNQLGMLEEAARRGLLPPEKKHILDQARKEAASHVLRVKIEANHASRESKWLTFYRVVPFGIAGAFAVFLFGRGVRYILANE